MNSRPSSGFTMVELMVVMALAALMVGVVVPMGGRLYETMQYRDAVRQLSEAVNAARYQAITRGSAMDLVLDPATGRYLLKRAVEPVDETAMSELDTDLSFAALTAAEVSPGRGLSAIRFYPDGASTGGSLSVQRPNGSGVRLRVNWLLGSVSQEALQVP